MANAIARCTFWPAATDIHTAWARAVALRGARVLAALSVRQTGKLDVPQPIVVVTRAFMAKRSASVSKGGDDPDAKTPRSASGGRKRAPKVVYAEPSEIRDGTAPESVDLAMSMLPVRTEEHKASVFKVMCW